MRLVLYQPEIPQNAGALIRQGACLGVGIDVIEPCGFVFDDRRLGHAAMDYRALADIARWASWQRFLDARGPGRLVLLTTRAVLPYTAFAFRPDDRIVLGRESSGVPEAADARLVIPVRPGARSLNVALAAAMVVGKALRQTGPAAAAP